MSVALRRVLALLSLLLLGVALMGQASAQEPKRGGTLRFGAFRAATSFDPHVAGGIHNAWLLGHIYDTLVTYSPSGEFVGALAESWVEETPTSYLFRIRKGVQFHDGTELTAHDVAATLDRIRDPETAAALHGIAQQIEAMDVLDSHTLRIVLKEPNAVFLHALASYNAYIVSAKDIESGFRFATETNGTGPFVLTDWEPERQYILDRNSNYWLAGLPYVDRLHILVIGDDKARADALRTGQIDIAEYIPWQHALALEFDHEVVYTFGSQSFIRINTHEPPFDDKRVRQALGYVLDRQQVLDLAFGGLGRIMTGPLQPEDSPYYMEHLENRYTHDWEKARQLLQEAGYKDPSELGPITFHVSVSAVSNEPGKVIFQQMQEFGLQVVWRSVDVPTLQRNRREGTYQLHMDGGGMAWPDPAYLNQLFHSTQGTSHAVGVRYKHERLDELLELAVATTDDARRRELYKEAEEILLDDAPWVWVLWRPQAEAYARYVKGYNRYPNALWQFNVRQFEHVWLDR